MRSRLPRRKRKIFERSAGTRPCSALDDDGVADGQEPNWNVDEDGDGRIDARDPDSDDDGVYDGTEAGLATQNAATDLTRGVFVADADPTTHTFMLRADSDSGGIDDGAEDINKNGRITLNMLDLYISERVKELTKGRQTPTTAKPATIPDFPIAVIQEIGNDDIEVAR